MNNQTTSYGKTLYTRVQYRKAKRLYESGKTIFVITSNSPLSALTANARLTNDWIRSTGISKSTCDNKSFVSVIFQLEYFNCNTQMGWYLKYFIESDIKDGDTNA